MSLRNITPVKEFKDILPQEYKDLVNNGPYAKNKRLMIWEF